MFMLVVAHWDVLAKGLGYMLKSTIEVHAEHTALTGTLNVH